MMLRTLLLTVSLCMLWSTALADRPEQWSIRGEAIRLDTDTHFYTEYHERISQANGQEHWLIHYISPEGELKAQKELIYTDEMPFVPDLTWQDFLAELKITGVKDGDQVLQDTNDPLRSEQRTAEITRPQQTAYDVGFDRLIRAQFAELQQAGRIRFDFLSLNTSQTFRFRAVLVTQDDTTLQVRVEPETAFIRLFVDPILLTYNIRTEQLVRYEGVTNFRRDGDLVKARITYENREIGENP